MKWLIIRFRVLKGLAPDKEGQTEGHVLIWMPLFCTFSMQMKEKIHVKEMYLVTC